MQLQASDGFYERMFQMPDIPQVDIPAELVSLKYPLLHFAKALKGGAPVRIVAMGSSSTAGRWDVVPYPPRLEMYLRVQYRDHGFPDLKIDVLNRGRGGEEAVEEVLRFDQDIFAEQPSLVIWQVGTNAVFHKKDKPYDLDVVADKIDMGLQRLRGQPMDVLLIDPQYAPAMLMGDKVEDSERMVALIAAAAEKANVNLFRRWALMQHWCEHDHIGVEQMLDPTDPDKLHQNDWSTLRVSQALRDAIVKVSPVVA
jgi:hypothetical protein